MMKPFSCEWFCGTKILLPFALKYKASSLEFPLLLVNSDSLRRQS